MSYDTPQPLEKRPDSIVIDDVIEPKKHYVGEVLKVQPGVKRVSRTKVYRGYLLTVAKKVEFNMDTNEYVVTESFDVFKPAYLYDRAVLSTNKYLPHQGKRECERRRLGGFAFQRWVRNNQLEIA